MQELFQHVRLDVCAKVVAFNVHQLMKNSGFLCFPITTGIDDNCIAAVV